MSVREQTEIVLFTSSAPHTWCLTRRGDQPWMSLTIARTDNQMIVGSIDTNDVEKIKDSISSSIDSIFVKAIHVMAPASNGICTAEVLNLIEAKLDDAVVFHRLETKFGSTQIQGIFDLAPQQLQKCTYTSIYKSASHSDRIKE